MENHDTFNKLESAEVDRRTSLHTPLGKYGPPGTSSGTHEVVGKQKNYF